MDRVMRQEELQEVFDQLLRDAMGKLAGIRLARLETAPSGDVCTVWVKFERG